MSDFGLLPILFAVAIVALVGAAELAGAVLSIFRADHRNPFARWFLDWLEHR
jgi:hypothetical protein